MNKCKYTKQCGGCDYQGMSYEKQLAKKQKYIEGLLAPVLMKNGYEKEEVSKKLLPMTMKSTAEVCLHLRPHLFASKNSLSAMIQWVKLKCEKTPNGTWPSHLMETSPSTLSDWKPVELRVECSLLTTRKPTSLIPAWYRPPKGGLFLLCARILHSSSVFC